MTTAWIRPLLSAFAGGALGWVSSNLSGGIPTTLQSLEAALAGAALAGLVAVVHLYQPVPSGKS